VLDLSDNPLCALAPSTLTSFLEYLKSQPSLIHLSLSSTRLPYTDCDAIVQTFNQFNKSVYGLHLGGLNVNIDSRGFLSHLQNAGVNETRIKGVQAVNKGRHVERGY